MKQVRKNCMSVWKRGFLEINAEILESLKTGPLQKTQISSLCNMDSRAVKKYLSLMQSIGLVESVNHYSGTFTLTNKGNSYLNHYISLVTIIEGDMDKLDSDLFTKLMSIRSNGLL